MCYFSSLLGVEGEQRMENQGKEGMGGRLTDERGS